MFKLFGMVEFLSFIPYESLEKDVGKYVSAYRERRVDGRNIPNPVYGVLERMDDIYILRREKDFVKLEEGEGVFVI